MLKKMFVPENIEVSEQFWMLHNEELLDVYRSPNIRFVKSGGCGGLGNMTRIQGRQNA